MALRLNDVRTKNKDLSENVKDIEENRILRPWEGFDKLGSQTRTFTARGS